MAHSRRRSLSSAAAVGRADPRPDRDVSLCPHHAETIPFAKPELRDPAGLAAKLQAVVESGMITNAEQVRLLEEEFAARVGVRHCVAVANATTGLILTAKCMGLTGEVILPSFTFIASVFPVVWNGLEPVFVDVDPRTCNVDPALVDRAVTPRTSAIIGVHVYGNPADESALIELAGRRGVRLIFDAAHGIGTLHRGVPVGAGGDAQVFSLSPTKVATGGEGGLVTTNDDELAVDLRLARNYGQRPDYVCEFAGLNARMSEMNAVVARHTLAYADEAVVRRQDLAARYAAGLADVPGLSLPEVDPRDRHSYKDLTIIVDPEGFGATRDELRDALGEVGISTRAYFDPPLHRQSRLGLPVGPNPLPHTECLASRVLSLPFFTHMPESDIDTVVDAIRGAR